MAYRETLEFAVFVSRDGINAREMASFCRGK